MGHVKTQKEFNMAYGYTGNKDLSEITCYSHNLYLNLTELYISTFSWSGLPKGLDATILETQLKDNQSVCIFRIPFTDMFLSLPYVERSKNPYGQPYSVKPISPYIDIDLELIVNRDCVLIYDNKVRYPVQQILTNYANRINKCDKIIDVNLDQQSLPYIYGVKQTMKKSFNDFIEKVKEFVPFMVVDEKMDIEKSFKSIDNRVEFKGLNIHELRAKLMCDVLEFIGIPNDKETKKERLIVNEVNQRMGLTNTNYFSRYDERNQALRRLRIVFNDFDEVKVERSSDLIGIIHNDAEWYYKK